MTIVARSCLNQILHPPQKLPVGQNRCWLMLPRFLQRNSIHTCMNHFHLPELPRHRSLFPTRMNSFLGRHIHHLGLLLLLCLSYRYRHRTRLTTEESAVTSRGFIRGRRERFFERHCRPMDACEKTSWSNERKQSLRGFPLSEWENCLLPLAQLE